MCGLRNAVGDGQYKSLTMLLFLHSLARPLSMHHKTFSGSPSVHPLLLRISASIVLRRCTFVRMYYVYTSRYSLSSSSSSILYLCAFVRLSIRTFFPIDRQLMQWPGDPHPHRPREANFSLVTSFSTWENTMKKRGENYSSFSHV